jgi:hypothetical protein
MWGNTIAIHSVLKKKKLQNWIFNQLCIKKIKSTKTILKKKTKKIIKRRRRQFWKKKEANKMEKMEKQTCEES